MPSNKNNNSNNSNQNPNPASLNNQSQTDRLSLPQYLAEIDKIAQTVPAELRDLFYYVEYSKITGQPLEPSVKEFVDKLDSLSVAEIEEMKQKNKLQNIQQKARYGRSVSRSDLDSLLQK